MILLLKLSLGVLVFIVLASSNTHGLFKIKLIRSTRINSSENLTSLAEKSSFARKTFLFSEQEIAYNQHNPTASSTTVISI
jgi:hypothetical protein